MAWQALAAPNDRPNPRKPGRRIRHLQTLFVSPFFEGNFERLYRRRVCRLPRLSNWLHQKTDPAWETTKRPSCSANLPCRLRRTQWHRFLVGDRIFERTAWQVSGRSRESVSSMDTVRLEWPT